MRYLPILALLLTSGCASNTASVVARAERDLIRAQVKECADATNSPTVHVVNYTGASWAIQGELLEREAVRRCMTERFGTRWADPPRGAVIGGQ